MTNNIKLMAVGLWLLLIQAWNWLTEFTRSLLAFLHYYLIVLPPILLNSMKNYLLSILPPYLTRVDAEGNYSLNDIGLGIIMIGVMLIVLWLVKKNGERERKWLE